MFVRSEKLLRKKQYSVDKKAAQFNPNNPKTWEGLVETHGDTVKGDTLKFVIPSLKFPVARKFVTDDIKVRTGESATVGGPGNIVDKNKSWPGFVEKFKPEQSSNLLKSPRIAVNNLKKQFPSLDRLQGELDLVRSGTLKEKTPYEKLRRRIEQTFKANNPLAQKYLNFLAKRRKDVRNHLGIAKDADEAIEFEEINIEEIDMSREELYDLAGKYTVPQIFINEKCIGGYDQLLFLYQNKKLHSLVNGK